LTFIADDIETLTVNELQGWFATNKQTTAQTDGQKHKSTSLKINLHVMPFIHSFIHLIFSDEDDELENASNELGWLGNR